MTLTQDVLAARHMVEESARRWNAHDRDGWVALAAERVRVEAPAGAVWESARQLIDTWTDAFPDNRVEISLVVADGGSAAQEARFLGTHTGTLRSAAGDIPPTGRSVDIPFLALLSVAEGRITSFRAYFDEVDMLTQLGLLPARS